MSSHREIFTDIYRRKVWGDGSGGGSAPGVAVPWAEIASKVIAHLKPRTVLDIGCGDGWASEAINLNGAWYYGVDPVEEMVDKCRARHHMRFGRTYLCLDAITDELPEAELVLLKEVTQHLSNASVAALLDKLRRYPAVLHCSAMDFSNPEDIQDGCYRPTYLRRYLDAHCIHRIESKGTWDHGGSSYFVELWRPQ